MNLGTVPVDTFKLGAPQVDKLMLGAVEVWSSGPPNLVLDPSFSLNDGSWSDAPGDAACVISEGVAECLDSEEYAQVALQQEITVEVGVSYTLGSFMRINGDPTYETNGVYILDSPSDPTGEYKVRITTTDASPGFIEYSLDFIPGVSAVTIRIVGVGEGGLGSDKGAFFDSVSLRKIITG